MVLQLAVTQLPELIITPDERDAILDYVVDTDNTYYMLLSNELHYYTVFSFDKAHQNPNDLPPIEDEVIACVQDLGIIKSIAPNEDGVIEIWITDIDAEKSYPLYFFKYDLGVIQCQ